MRVGYGAIARYLGGSPQSTNESEVSTRKFDSVVCRSVIWSGCAIERAAFVDHAVVADLAGLADLLGV